MTSPPTLRTPTPTSPTTPTSPPIVHTVADEDAGERADVVLGRRVPGLSRRVARGLALAGHLRVDERPAPAAHRVRAGERLELRVPAIVAPPPPPLVVLAVTARFVYVDKPPGLHTLRLRPGDPPALADLVAAAFPDCATASPDPREHGAVHRLDGGTSGVVAFARDRDSHAAARAAFSAGDARKRYLAIVTCPEDHVWPGPPALWRTPEGDTLEVHAPLGPGSSPSRMAVRSDGQPSRSRVHRPQPRADGRARVALELVTGRRHQARVHLAWLAMPILGDLLYGGAPADRLYLHAATLDLGALDPAIGPVTAPDPPGFEP
jgi:23S rRNA pseudouridine1911/1915/1917 synthase